MSRCTLTQKAALSRHICVAEAVMNQTLKNKRIMIDFHASFLRHILHPFIIHDFFIYYFDLTNDIYMSCDFDDLECFCVISKADDLRSGCKHLTCKEKYRIIRE